MNLGDKFFDYLKLRIDKFEKVKKSNAYLFTCPNIANHKLTSKNPTATLINGSDKIVCLQCNFKGTPADVVRLLEPEQRSKSDTDILIYLADLMKVDVYPELENYQSYNWALVPIAKNSKIPIEKDWTNIEHKDKLDWIKWLNNGLNIGIRTGEVSGITVIDVDFQQSENETANEVIKQLVDSNTLIQNSPHGRHFIFKYDKDIPQTVNIADLKIDVRNDGGQIIVQPSSVDNLNYHWVNLGNEIQPVPENVKVKLLELLKLDVCRNYEKLSKKSTILEEVKVIGEGGRNNLLTSIGGLLINKLNSEQTKFVLSVISNNFMKPPLPSFEIDALMGSLSGYKESEDLTQEKAIYEYLKQIQNDVNAKDVMDSLKLGRAVVDKYLSKFVKEGKAIRLSRGRYKFREKVEWSDKFPETLNKIDYKIPYFNDVANFCGGDILLLGGRPKHGKSTIGLNIIKQIVEQGIKPYYIYSESGSRHWKIAKHLGLTEGNFYSAFHANPLSIELEPNSFTVIDWLMISEKETSDAVFKFFTEEVQRKGGILVILMQLKENYDFFAPNMVTQFPALAARYIFDGEDGSSGHWQIDAMRDPKGNYRNYTVSCNYNPETKELISKSLI